MKLLYSYLRNYKSLVFLALLLAAINQIFSLLDPVIVQKILDRYVAPKDPSIRAHLTVSGFIRGAGAFILLAIGVAMVSRIAKAFQDYYVNVITQRLGAQIYSDGLRHSLELPYSVFEDQRSGETLGKLQKVRDDTQKLIFSFVNILFTTIVGLVFVTIIAIKVYWVIAMIYLGTIPVLGFLSFVLSGRIKTMQKTIVKETIALAGSTT